MTIELIVVIEGVNKVEEQEEQEALIILNMKYVI